MFYSHQLRDREALIRQMCKEILNPSVPMALKLLGTVRGGVVIVNEHEVSLLHDHANRLLDEIKSAWNVKPAVDPTFLLKDKTEAKFEAVTLPENNADIGDVEQSIDYSNKFTGSATFQQPACLVMRLDNIDELTESFREKETNAGCHQDGNIRNSSVADDIFNRHPVTQTDQSFPQLWEAGQVTIKPQQHLQKQKPASKEAREAPGIMDNEQTMILSNLYQTCGQSSVDIQVKCPKTAEHAKAESAVKLSKLVELPPVALSCELVGRNHDVYYPKPNLDLWITSMQPLQDSPFDSGRCYRKDYLMFNGVGTSNPSATAAISDSSPGPGFVEPPQPSLIADHGTPQTQRPAFPQQPENNAAPGLPRPNAASPENHVPIRGPTPIQGPARIRGPVPVPQETPIPILFAHPTGGPQYADDFFDNLELIGMTTREECLPLGNIQALQPHIEALVSHHHLVTNIPFFSMLLQHDKPRYNTRFLTLPILYDRLITLTDRIIILHPDYIRHNRLESLYVELLMINN
ncbi:sister chromatid cohesion 1 protein 1-like [Beta vulgaris subsp. vulgaris]|uniref:sister chromatid cohesion 1 protein 1-like n=1 Tax=Beta vulgaris subsp. vulgaris TaxID=3555 RepID=UPI002036867E|nr:sister chromatid cohesion 1 protein 1-like [Beta vulgaris subsp. vulgaris]